MVNFRKLLVLPVALAGLLLLGFGISQSKEEHGLEVTVYNEDLALVTQEQMIDIKPGLNTFQFSPVPRNVDGSSIQVDWGDLHDAVQVREQNFSPGFSGQYELFGAYLNTEITLALEDGRQINGVLRSYDHGQLLLETRTGYVSINQSKIVEVSGLEKLEEISTIPGFRFQIHSNLKEETTVAARFSYLTGGLSWDGDYRLELDEDMETAKLDIWATLTNTSNFAFNQALLRLVSGTINRGREVQPLPYAKAAVRGFGADMEMAAPAGRVEQEGFADYHLYTIQEPTTLKPFETKQLRLGEASEVPVTKKYLYDSRLDSTKVGVNLSFTNDELVGLGEPLPRGKVRIYARDAEGNPRFAGEDRLEQVLVDTSAEISMGYASNLRVERVQTETVRPSKDLRQESYALKLTNGGTEPMTVVVREHLDSGANWEIIKKTAKLEQIDSETVEFTVSVPAKSEVTLEYTVRYIYQA